MKTPFHLWIVGVLSLVWNAGGAVDYVMTQTRNEDYLAQLNEVQLDYILNVPAWFEFFWGLGVWMSVLGSILLLARSRYAGTAFGLSLIGLIGGSIYTYFVASPSGFEFGTTFSMLFTLAIFLVLVALLLYAQAMTRRGVLR